MKKLGLVLVVAILSSAATAAALTLPALARDGDGEDRAFRLPLWPAFGEGRAKLEEFEACMKEQGFDLSGEVTVRITPDGVTVNGKKVDRETFEKAEDACGTPLQLPELKRGAIPNLEVLPDELQQKMEKVRECLEEARTA